MFRQLSRFVYVIAGFAQKPALVHAGPPGQGGDFYYIARQGASSVSLIHGLLPILTESPRCSFPYFSSCPAQEAFCVWLSNIVPVEDAFVFPGANNSFMASLPEVE